MFDPYTLRTLINEHGTTVTLRKRSNGAYDPASGSVVQSNTDYSVKAYFFNADMSIAEFKTVMTGERRVVVSDKLNNGNTTPDIDATDQIIGFGDTVNVTRASKITSDGVAMCHLLYVKE